MRVSILGIAIAMLLACGSGQNSANVVKSGMPRVVSLDYCADQFVIKLLPREHIAAVSPDAQKHFSYMRAQAAELPTVRPSAEDVLSLEPTLVVRSYGGGPMATTFYDRAGVQVVQLGFPTDMVSLKANIIEVARQLGVAAKGTALVKEMDARLSRLPKRAQRQVALYTTPGGVTTGPQSLVNEVMQVAGLDNFEQQAGWRDLPLERLVSEQPDLLAAASFGDPSGHVDPWTLARHPRVKHLQATTPAVPLEGAWTSCGGWFLMDAIEALARIDELLP